MYKIANVRIILFLMLLSVFAAACAPKINRANFEQIQTDMAQEEVYRILGEPTETSGITIGAFSGASATWTSDEASISVQFLNDKVVAKQFAVGRNLPRTQEEER